MEKLPLLEDVRSAPPEEPPVPPDIVVIGVNTNLDIKYYEVNGYSYFYKAWGVGYNFPGGYPNYNPGTSNTLTGMFDQYRIDVLDMLGRPKTADEQAAVDVLVKAKDQLQNTLLTAVLEGKVYKNANGETFTAADVKSKWFNTDFAVTDKAYTNGGVGETHAKKGSLDVFLEINIGGLIGYTGGPASQTPWVTEQQRIDYAIAYILHESIHATNMGLDRSSNISKAEQTATNPKWLANEGTAWAGAAAILMDLGKGGLPFTPLQGVGPAFTSTTTLKNSPLVDVIDWEETTNLDTSWSGNFDEGYASDPLTGPVMISTDWMLI